MAASPATSPNADKIFKETVQDPAINSRIKQAIADALNHMAKKLPCAAEMQPQIAKLAGSFVDSKMQPLVTQILQQEFSEAELGDIANFLNTPTGKKIIAKTPDISDRANQIALQAALENSGELTAILTKSVNSDGSCKTAQ